MIYIVTSHYEIILKNWYLKMTKKTKDLLNSWALPDRTEDRTQVTLRLDFDTYAKLHALKNVYPHRSVNEFINDLLKDSVDDVIEALGEPQAGGEEYIEEAGGMVSLSDNAAYRFKAFYSMIMEQGKECSLLGIVRKADKEIDGDKK